MEKHASGLLSCGREITVQQLAIVLVSLLCLATAGISLAAAVPSDAGFGDIEVVDAVDNSVMTFMGPVADADRATLDWAVDRFEANGLQLPSLTVEFPTTCGGKSARYFVSAAHIEFCDASRLVVLHELAHAWDDAARLVDRDNFMQRRQADHWFAQQGRRPSESGGEQLAKIVAWGLMDTDTSTPILEVEGGELVEVGREIRGIGRGEVDVLTADFEWLVGFAPLHLDDGSTAVAELG